MNFFLCGWSICACTSPLRTQWTPLLNWPWRRGTVQCRVCFWVWGLTGTSEPFLKTAYSWQPTANSPSYVLFCLDVCPGFLSRDSGDITADPSPWLFPALATSSMHPEAGPVRVWCLCWKTILRALGFSSLSSGNLFVITGVLGFHS